MLAINTCKGNPQHKDEFGITNYEKTLHLGDEVCYLAEDENIVFGFFLHKVIKRIGDDLVEHASIVVSDSEIKTPKYRVGVQCDVPLDDTKFYKVVQNRFYKGGFICYENNYPEVNYPYYSPLYDENCYGVETEVLETPKMDSKEIHFANTLFECETGVRLQDGTIIIQSDTLSGIFLNYETKFNLKTRKIDDGEFCITLNQLIENGLAQEVHCYQEVVIGEEQIGDVEHPDFQDIADNFAEQGVRVSVDGLKHNYNAWLANEKSGYRDEKRGTHIFTPCGGNPLQFRVTTLSQRCEDWQTTYEW